MKLKSALMGTALLSTLGLFSIQASAGAACTKDQMNAFIMAANNGDSHAQDYRKNCTDDQLRAYFKVINDAYMAELTKKQEAAYAKSLATAKKLDESRAKEAKLKQEVLDSAHVEPSSGNVDLKKLVDEQNKNR